MASEMFLARFAQSIRRADSRALFTAGRINDINKAMMLIETRSSIKVIPALLASGRA
jgi:hypothetical protein